MTPPFHPRRKPRSLYILRQRAQGNNLLCNTLLPSRSLPFSLSPHLRNPLQLACLDLQSPIMSFTDFKEKLLLYFEPANRELGAGKLQSNLKQFGKFNTVRAFNKEFARWLLQARSIDSAERLFPYSKRLKHHIRIEFERALPPSSESAMSIHRIGWCYSLSKVYL